MKPLFAEGVVIAINAGNDLFLLLVSQRVNIGGIGNNVVIKVPLVIDRAHRCVWTAES